MDIKKVEIDELNAQLRIKIDAADYQPKVEEVLSNYRRTASVPGFRKGKVPMGMVKKMYGKGVLVEEVNKLMQQQVFDFLNSENLEILGNPIPTDENEQVDWSEGNDFEFSFEVGLSPEFEVKITKKNKLPFYQIKADDATIDRYTEDLARRYGAMTNAEKSEEGDTLYGKFTPAGEGDHSNEATVMISAIKDAKIQKKFIGIGPDDIVEFDVLKAFDNNLTEVSSMLNLPKEEITDENKKWNFQVIRVNHLVPAELNQELFDKIFGEGNVNGIEEFRAKVGEDIEKMYEQESDRRFLNDATEYILDKTKFDLPDAFLKRWLMTVSENPLTEEQVEAEYAQYQLSTKWQLIENRIAKDNDMQITREEVLGFAENAVRSQMLQYGIPEPDEEMVKNTASKVLENEEESKRISDEIFSRKLLAFFKESFKLDEKEVTYDEFVEKATK
jgi:trigger factor